VFRKLVNRYFDYLERKGKKYVIVSFTGKVYGFRYFPFFEETSDGIFPYPNLMINQSMCSCESAVIPHSHPWAVVSFIIKGGYSHYHNGRWAKKHAPAMIALTSKGVHCIDEVLYDSYSIFCHWFKKSEWIVHKELHVDTGAVEHVPDEDLTYSLAVNDGDIPHAGIAVIRYTPEIARKIKIRQKAIERLSRNA
jgi:hypothetical protein